MPSKRRSIALKVACVIPVMTTSETQRFNAPEGAVWKLVSTDPRGEHSIRAPLLAEINPLNGGKRSDSFPRKREVDRGF